MLDDALIAKAGRRVSEAAPPSSWVILFGSAARGELVIWDKAVAVTDRDVGPTPYHMVILEDGSVFTSCGSGTECSATVEAGHTYTASVEDSEGHNFGGTVISSIKVASLAGLFAGGSDVCAALLTDPAQTHFAGSSVGDQTLECEAALGRGATVAQALAAVAATTGGSAALWWLMHEGTISQPGFELPAPSEADPYPVPAVLPEAWPVKEIAAEIEAKNSTSELTKERTGEVARRCLWHMSQAGNDGSECATLPLFLSGSDVPTATLHDLKALAGHPGWVRLNYENGTAKAERENRKWYEGVGGCASEREEGKQCRRVPLLRLRAGRSESRSAAEFGIHRGARQPEQGTAYGGFLSSCKVGSADGNPFLAVPIPPSAGIPTTRLCN